ncbi:MAG: BON domain-containing protein [Mariniblastus sp.]
MSVLTNSLVQQIQSAVVHNPHLNHKRMHVKTKEGRVVIEGTVQSFFEKQMAQEALRKIVGIKKIDNQLTVNWS